MRLIACLIKHPRQRHRMAFILRGAEGVGKDTLIAILKAIYGPKLVHRTEDLGECFPDGGGFNAVLKGKLLVCLNEVSGERFNRYKELIKGSITAEEVSIREKYQPTVVYQNYMTLWLLSNRANPVTLEGLQRRFEMFKAGNYNKGKVGFWNAVYEKVEDSDEIDRLYSWLIADAREEEFQLSTFNAYKDRPHSEETRRAETASVPLYIHWLSDFFTNARYRRFEHAMLDTTVQAEDKGLFDPAAPQTKKKASLAIKSSILCLMFRQWAEAGGWIRDGFNGNRWLKVQLMELPGVRFDVSTRIGSRAPQRMCRLEIEVLSAHVEAALGETVEDDPGNVWIEQHRESCVGGFIVE